MTGPGLERWIVRCDGCGDEVAGEGLTDALASAAAVDAAARRGWRTTWGGRGRWDSCQACQRAQGEAIHAGVSK